MKQKYNIASALLAGVAGLALLAPTAKAQVFTYTAEDLLLGIRSAGPNDFVVDLGPSSFFRTAAAGTYDISTGRYNSSQLTSAFGGLDGLSLSVFGDVRTTGGSLPNNTLWMTAARPDINVQTIPWQRKSSITQGNTGAKIDGVAGGAVGYSGGQPAGPNNTATAVVMPDNYAGGSYQVSVGTGNWGGTFVGNSEGNTGISFAAGGVPVRLDLYELQPAAGNPAGTWLGYFDFKPNGTASFTVVPESSAWATIGGGACLLFAAFQRRRLQRGFGLKNDATSMQA
jgi:hypothetical protein